MDGGSVFVLVFFGVILLVIVIGATAVISYTILRRDRMLPRTTGNYWVNRINNGAVGPPKAETVTDTRSNSFASSSISRDTVLPTAQPIFTTPEALSCDKILSHCNNILNHSHQSHPAEIRHPAAHAAPKTYNIKPSNDFHPYSPHRAKHYAVSSTSLKNIDDEPKSVQQLASSPYLRPRSQSLGSAPLQLMALNSSMSPSKVQLYQSQTLGSLTSCHI